MRHDWHITTSSILRTLRLARRVLASRAMRHAFVGLAVCLVAAACGGKSTAPSSSSSSSSSGSAGADEPCPDVDYCALRCSPTPKDTPLYPPHCTIPSCSCLVGVTARDDWSGTYSLDSAVDAINVVLEQDGTFHWTLDACDAQGGDCGEWRKSQPQTIVLIPTSGKTSFNWPTSSGVGEAQQLIVTSLPSGGISVEHPETGEKPTFTAWTPGRQCAACGGASGVTKSACNTPVERRCR
jgi:hypothetical protein